MSIAVATPLGAALRALLLSDARIQAAVDDRIRPQSLPLGSALPAITYLRIGGEPEQEHGGLSGLEHAEVQFDAWAPRDMEAESLGVFAQWVLVDDAPGFEHDGIELDSVLLVRDRGASQDRADQTDDDPIWRYSFDANVSFRRLVAA
jgi:hypothetical protein